MTVSEEWFERGCRTIPGGVNSPVWSVDEIGTNPLFMESALGSRIVSADGRDYIDYVLAFSSILFGHAHPQIVAAMTGAVGKGCSLGAPTRLEVELAEQICKMVPSIDMIRMVNSGTEAAFSAIRLARACTGRDKIIKFSGSYHGFADMFMVESGLGGPCNRSVPGSLGVPESTVDNTLLAQYNDTQCVEAILDRNSDDVAAVIIEPVAASMGVVPPAPGFLETLRRLCDAYSVLLIFDESLTGFRLGPGGGQVYYGVRPDLTILGKVLSGGLPFGAYGGKADLMQQLSPVGKVYQGGSTAGNHACVAAGLAVLKLVEQADYAALEQNTARLASGLQEVISAAGYPVRMTQVGSMFSLFFTDQPVVDLVSAEKSDLLRYAKFYRQMREAGIYLPPSNTICAVTSFAHRQEDFERTIAAAKNLLL